MYDIAVALSVVLSFGLYEGFGLPKEQGLLRLRV